MKNQLGKLHRDLAQSVTRRQALRRFGVGLAGMALACFGLTEKAQARNCAAYGYPCASNADCCSGFCTQSLTCGCMKDGDCPRSPKGRARCEVATGFCLPTKTF